jgi:ribosomal protein L32
LNISPINKPMLAGPLAATSHFISKDFSDTGNAPFRRPPFQRSADENRKSIRRDTDRRCRRMIHALQLQVLSFWGSSGHYAVRHATCKRPIKTKPMEEPLWSGSGERLQSLPKWKCTAGRHRSKRPDPATELDRNGNETGG